MYKILAIFGASGAGKDYLLTSIKRLYEQTSFFNKALEFKISATTRPARTNEEQGINYYFFTDDVFDKAIENNEFLEWQTFGDKGWKYGTHRNALSKNIWNIGIFNINGITQLLKRNDCRVIPVLITVSDKTRLIRQLERETDPDIDEIIRRYTTDKEDFSKIPFNYFKIDNEGSRYPVEYIHAVSDLKLEEPSAVIELANLIQVLD